MKTSTIKFCIMFLALFAFTSVSAQHFQFVGGDEAFENWQINIYEAVNTADLALQADDEIAVFDGSNLVGHIILTNTPSINNWYDNVLVAYTKLEGGANGYEGGNPVTFVAWDRSIGQEVVLDTIAFHPEWYAPHNSATFPEIWTYSYVSLRGGGTVAYGSISGDVWGDLGYTDADPITGYEYDRPIDSVFVVVDQKGTYTDSTTTEGAFSINNVKTGTHNVLFSKYGWGDTTVSVIVTDGANTVIPILYMDTMPTSQHYPFIPLANTAKESWQLHIYETILPGGATLDETDEVIVYDSITNTMVGHIRLLDTPTEMNWFDNTLWCWSEFADGSTGYTPGNTPIIYAWDVSEQKEYKMALDFHDTWFATVDSIQYFADTLLNETFPAGYDYSYVSLTGTETVLYTLSGNIDDHTAANLKDAVITVNGDTVMTGTDGNYSMTLRAGFYDIVLRADGYVTEYNNNFDLSGGDDTWDVQMTQFSQHFGPVVGDAVYDVWTLYIESATIQGVDMVEQDEIAIYDEANVVGDGGLVGSIVLDQVCTLENRGGNDLIAFTVLSTEAGFEPDAVYTFKGYDLSETQEFTLFTSTLKPSGAYTGFVFPDDENTYSHLNIDFQYPSAQITGTHDVPGATVYATNGFKEYSATVSGINYTINNVLAGHDYDITSTAVGYNDYVGGTFVNVLPGSTNTENISMVENCRIEGYVKIGAVYIIGARVQLFAQGTTSPVLYEVISTAQIGATGKNFEIDNVESDVTYDYVIKAVGYIDKSGSKAVGAGNTESIDETLTVAAPASQAITLTEGFQFISRNVTPASLAFDNLLRLNAPSLTTTEIDYVLANNGDKEEWDVVNSDWDAGIGDWAQDEGYQILVKNPGDGLKINMSGPYIDGEIVPLALTRGNPVKPVMIPYLQIASEDVDSVFASIKDSLEWVKNSTGHMLRKVNGVWIDNIGDMNPGEGYQVQMIGDATLIYNTDVPKRSMDQPTNGRSRELQYFEFAGGNPESYVYTIYIQAPDFEIGDEIAVYDGDRLVGAIALEDNGTLYNDLVAFRYVMDGVGYTPGNEFSFKGYDASTGYVYDLAYELAPANTEVHLESTFPNGRGHYSIAYLSANFVSTVELARNAVKVFPNPTQGQVTIESPFDIYDMYVMDLTGKVIFSSEVNAKQAQMSTQNMVNGVYFIKLTTEEGILTQKLIVNK